MRHKAVKVNGGLVNIPSYSVKPNDIVAIADKARQQVRIQDALTVAEQLGIPEWMDVDRSKMEGVFKAVPDRVDLPPDIDEALVVALYSK